MPERSNTTCFFLMFQQMSIRLRDLRECYPKGVGPVIEIVGYVRDHIPNKIMIINRSVNVSIDPPLMQ